MTRTLARIGLLLLLVLGIASPACADTPSSSAMDDPIAALRHQLEAVQAELRELALQNKDLVARQAALERELQQQRAVVGTAPTALAAAPSASVAVPSPMAAAVTPPSASDHVRLWGYGEAYYSNPTGDHAKAQADLARAVFGIGYLFDERTEFNSEYEVEHAVSSANDVGEFEVEQFFVDHQVSDRVSVRAGLFLMPFGMLNEHHEPTNFYGMQRNFIETLIIPSTWREGGVGVHGNTESGIDWNVGVTTGFDLSKWNFTPEFPPYATALDLANSHSAPLQASHQELSLANAHDLSQYLSIRYSGIPGLSVGVAISTGKAVPVPAPPNSPLPDNQRVTLWEGHARWTTGAFDLSALYARGAISNLAAVNAAVPGSPNPVPSSFYGYFLQAAYGLWERNEYRLAPFVRYERYNLGASYEGTAGPAIPTGLVPLSAAPGQYGYWPQNQDRVWTTGANFYVTPHVVLKADYQWFHVNTDFNRIDLGLGLSF